MGGWLQIRKEHSLVANSHLTGSRMVIGRAPDCDVSIRNRPLSPLRDGAREQVEPKRTRREIGF